MALSKRDAARQRQLANLQRGGGRPASIEHRPALRHGGYAQLAAAQLDAKARDIFDALAADAPLREAGELPRADSALVRLAAECLCRLDTLSAYLTAHGILDAKGNVRSAAELERRLRAEAADHLDALGMTPRSRAKLGVDVQRGFDLAQQWAAQDDAEGRELEAGGDG